MRRMSTMILLSAIPGSGKSTWAKEYQRTHKNVYIVSSDQVRVKLFGSAQCFKNERLVWETFLSDINAHACEDCTVIADATNLQNAYRRYYHQNTPGFDKHVLVVFKIPFDVCMRQNKMRTKDRVVCDEAMYSLFREFEEVQKDVVDLYDEYILIEGDYVEQRLK